MSITKNHQLKSNLKNFGDFCPNSRLRLAKIKAIKALKIKKKHYRKGSFRASIILGLQESHFEIQRMES